MRLPELLSILLTRRTCSKQASESPWASSMITVTISPAREGSSRYCRSLNVSSDTDSSEVAGTPEARRIVANSKWGFKRGSSMAMMRMRWGSVRMSMRTSVVLPVPEGPWSTHSAPCLES